MKFTSLVPLLVLGVAVSTMAQDAPRPAQDGAAPAAEGGPRMGGDRGPRGGGDRGPRGGGDRGPRMGGDRGPRMGGGDRGPRMGGDRGPRMGMGGEMGAMAADFENRMFLRMITRPQFAKELGLSEDVVNNLNDTFTEIDVRVLALQEELEAAMKEQDELLKATPLDEEAVMKAVEKVWDIRKQMAEFQTRKLIAVLTTLTPEQTAKAREMMQNRRPGGFGGGRGGQGFGGRGPNGGERPAPPADAPQPPAEK